MAPDPLSIALREVVECQHLIEALVLSSESFDYRGAKRAIKELDQKKRELARLRTQIEKQKAVAHPENVHVLDFSPAVAEADR